MSRPPLFSHDELDAMEDVELFRYWQECRRAKAGWVGLYHHMKRLRDAGFIVWADYSGWELSPAYAAIEEVHGS